MFIFDTIINLDYWAIASFLSKIFFTSVFIALLVWTIIQWGFAVSSFRTKQPNYLGTAAAIFWWFMIMLHLIVIYALWAVSISVIWLIITIFISHAMYVSLIVGKGEESTTS